MRQEIPLDTEAQETLVSFIKAHKDSCDQTEIRIQTDGPRLSFWCVACGESYDTRK